ncbi:PepSY-associated TM helix domain-containing protein [Derxia lacustris]|uniref:PepSY-associated TM helix domain-containing protein n=1 Tax=Derxia lacustris TaxID=764842 RepID=UPI000A1708E1|nr:PepSY-associated TM helix domain-containing protein [Derxia lacustris]
MKSPDTSLVSDRRAGAALRPADAQRETQREAQRRAQWLKTLRNWHWISSAICLAGLLLFSLTGITLNHAGQIESHAKVQRLALQLAPSELAALTAAAPTGTELAPPLPATVAGRIEDAWPLTLADARPEWSADEVYVSLPRPGGDAWLRIALADGAAEAEITDRGWIAWLNDLHKGRNTGRAWSLFIDVFALACLVFALSGLLILQVHAGKRPSTWPLVAAGVAVPLALAVVFLH